MHDDPAAGGAALARGAEGTPEYAFDGEIEIGIVHDDHRVLAAHFQRDTLVRAGGARGDIDTGLSRSGEADNGYIGMIDDGITDVLTIAKHEIDDAGRNT